MLRDLLRALRQVRELLERGPDRSATAIPRPRHPVRRAPALLVRIDVARTPGSCVGFEVWRRPFRFVVVGRRFEVRQFEDGPFEVRPFEVRPLEVRAAEIGPFEDGPFEVRPFEVRLAEIGPFEDGPFEVRLL